MRLQVSENVRLFPRESLIVFDEVQLCPKARQMIKHLVADGRFDYIETGSLISIKANVKDILIPSEEVPIDMHPMDFEEFLWASGDEMTVPFIRERFEKREPLGNAMHNTIMKKYREYMIVGGMPQAVIVHLEGKDLKRTNDEKRKILNLYHNDVDKISAKAGIKVERIFDKVPSLLSKHVKTFSPGKIEHDSRTRDYVNSIAWLAESKTLNICHATTDPDITLRSNIDENRFKCYMADTGLLVTSSFSNNLSTPNEVYNALLFGKLSINEGMFFENMVSQELVFNGYDLVFSVFKKEDSEKPFEVDFLISKGKKISPIEVKSGESGKHASLDEFMKRYHRRLGECYVVHSKDLKMKDGVTYIPIYMTMFL
jgi:uncharacterized protein